MNKATQLLQEVRRLSEALAEQRPNPVFALKRYLYLYRKRKFSPNEIHFFRMLGPELSEEDLCRIVSKEELLEVQYVLNPVAFHHLTEDKLAFYRHCKEHGIVTPEILGVLSRNEGDAQGFRCVTNLADFEELLGVIAGQACILKPVHGLHGEGVTRITRRQESWEAFGGVRNAEEIFEIVNGSSYDEWMLQELVYGNAKLQELSRSSGLQTVRVVTLVDASGGVNILAARLRLICTDAPYDNFDYGRTGNVIANLDIGTGTIVSAVGGRGVDPQLCSVTRHPRTNADLIGFEVPGWQEIRELAIQAANVFTPLRTVGWDIGITDSEPVLIEGNVTWDTLSGDPRMGDLLNQLRSEV